MEGILLYPSGDVCIPIFITEISLKSILFRNTKFESPGSDMDIVMVICDEQDVKDFYEVESSNLASDGGIMADRISRTAPLNMQRNWRL